MFAVGYPERILADDEQVVEHLHPNWSSLVAPVFWFLVLCAGIGAGLAGISGVKGTGHSVLVWIILVVGLVLLTWLSIAPAIRWKTTHYVFTTHRVLIRRGVLKHEGRDISLQRINDVGFSQTLWERILRSGSLMIESAGEHGQERLTNIPRSDIAQQTLNRLIEQDAERRARLGSMPPGGYGGYPQQGYPSQGYPTQGYPTQGYPAPGYQQPGYQQPGYPPPGYPQQGYPPEHYPPTQSY